MSTSAADKEDDPTTARVNIARLSQNEALSLLQQYNSIVVDDPTGPQTLPHIKIAMRSGGARAVPVRERITTKSLERVDRPGAMYFTEGLSSISKFKEPLLAMHRRDILGANMPDTVRLARERSHVTIGVNSYRPRRQRHGPRGPRNMGVKSMVLEPGSVTASQITAPLVLPQNADMTNAWEERSVGNESRIARMLKRIEERYGKDVVDHALPSTPSVQSVEFYTSSPTVTTPVRTPRRTPVKEAKPTQTSLKVVSIGQSLSDLHPKPRLPVNIPKQSKNTNYDQIERYKQHVTDKKQSRFEIRYKAMKEHKPGLHFPYGSEKKSFFGQVKPKASIKKKRQIVVSLTDITGTPDQDEAVSDEERKKPEPKKSQKGTFNVEGVKGVGKDQRLWSPSSVSTAASVVNPPPSVEAGLYDLELPHTRDPAAMFTVEEEGGGETSRLQAPAEHLSDGNDSTVSSSLLSVPFVAAGKERRPQEDLMWGERPPRRDNPVDEDVLSTSRQVQPSSEVKVTNIELYPGSEHRSRPTISVSDSDEVEADIQKQKESGPELHSKEVESNIKVLTNEHIKLSDEHDHDTRSESRSKDKSPAVSVHNQSITFISPLETQANAKRQ
ncbi:uncharacterized protein LOC124256462 [Haliotis rubra]|uniref:uncharacterized protein LOC124256462 n=1 Tax=Haliotis rubra TaxID=36100 RepID=UPI001EE58311|nr:uncharacterized protein LOC124256462 [Haliotis rubra]